MTEIITQQLKSKFAMNDNQITAIKIKLQNLNQDVITNMSEEELTELKESVKQTQNAIELDIDLFNSFLNLINHLLDSRKDLKNLINGTNKYKNNGILNFIKNRKEELRKKQIQSICDIAYNELHNSFSNVFSTNAIKLYIDKNFTKAKKLTEDLVGEIVKYFESNCETINSLAMAAQKHFFNTLDLEQAIKLNNEVATEIKAQYKAIEEQISPTPPLLKETEPTTTDYVATHRVTFEVELDSKIHKGLISNFLQKQSIRFKTLKTENLINKEVK